MNKYIITKRSDPYHAQRHGFSRAEKKLEWVGATPVKVVMDDNNGRGYDIREAYAILNSYYRFDTERGNEGGYYHHLYFEKTYESDTIIYAIEKLD